MNLLDIVELLAIVAIMIGATGLFGLFFARLFANSGHHVAFVQEEYVSHPYSGRHVQRHWWARRTR